MGTVLYIDGVILRDISKDELQGKLEEADGMIQYYRDQLMILAGAGVSGKAGSTVEEWMMEVRMQVADAIDGLEEEFVKKHLIIVALSDLNSVHQSN